MAQFYQVVHVSNDDTINNPEVQQQVLLDDQQIVLNDGQSTIYQNNTNNQYQTARIQKIPCSVGESVNTQGQHSQVIIQQRQQPIEHHQTLPQQQAESRPQDTILQLAPTQDGQQNSVQPTQHIFYNSDPMLSQNALVHHSTLAGQPHSKKQIYSAPHIIQTQPSPQIATPNQTTVAQQHLPIQSQQQIVYRMQATQQPAQIQTAQMIAGNTHVILQQPSGQQVFIPTHQQQDITIIRSPIPQQRIVYPRLYYSTTHQNSVMQPGQHIQITSPMNQQTNIVQARIASDSTQSSVQTSPQHQNVLFHPMHSVPTTTAVQKTNQVQMTPQSQVTNNGSNTIRFSKLPAKVPPSIVGSGIYGKTQSIRPDFRPGPGQLTNPVQKAPRPRGGLAGVNRNRAPKQRGGNMIVCRSPMINKTQNPITVSTGSGSAIGQTPSKSQQTQTSDKPPAGKQIFRTLTLPVSQSNQEYSSPQPQIMHRPTAPKFRSPPITTNSQNQPRLITANNTNSTPATANTGQDLDLEDSIQAVIVKKEPTKPQAQSQQQQQPQPISQPQNHPQSSGTQASQGTTLSTYPTKDDDDNQMVRTPSGCMTLTEFKKRNPGTLPTRGTIPNRPLPTQANKGSLPVSNPSSSMGRPSNKMQQSSNTSVGQSSASSVLQTAHNNYEIQTQHVLQNRSGQQMPEKDRNSAKMLVICVSGDQRLITFTLPRESCTVQDLLEQVGVPFDANTTIQCVENPGANIDFVVTVGFSMQESPSELISRAEQTLQLSRQQEANAAAAAAAAAAANNESNAEKGENNSGSANTVPSNAKQPGSGTISNTKTTENSSSTTSSATNTSAATHQKANTEDIPRKIIEGFLAVCHNCGFSGYDHARCERCKTIFSDPPKKTPLKSAPNSTGSSAQTESNQLSKNASPDIGEKKKDIVPKVVRGNNGVGRPKANTMRIRAARRKAETEVVILTLSSDEEDDEDSNMGSNTAPTNSNTDGTSKTNLPEPLPFEPNLSDSDESASETDFTRDDVTDLSSISDPLSIEVACSSVRIGLLKYCPEKPLTLNSRGLCIEAPLKTEPKTNYRLHIHKVEVAKILGHFSPNSESIIVIYTRRACGNYIKSAIKSDELDFKSSGASSLGPFDARRIILVFNLPCDKSRNIIRSILSPIEELSRADKQQLLSQLAQYDTTEDAARAKQDDNSSSANAQANSSDIVQNLLVYPPGKGGLAISVNDYMCLATEQYLNDIIIDFYLKWVHNTIIPVAQRDKTFIFSTFFYKRLTTMARGPHEKDSKQTAVQRRHSRVQNWTKNVNLFEKDYIIIPINEQSHWFLAIICFPNLRGPVTFDTNKPVELPSLKKPKNQKVSLQIGNTTITPLSKRETNSSVLAERVGIGDDGSERDEAEGEDSDLLSEDSNIDSAGSNANSNPNTSNSSLPMSGSSTSSSNSNSNNNISTKQEAVAIKQPLILIFDSLTGASRSRVVATLRNYLTCEYKAKLPDSQPYTFNKDNMPGHSVKVPQQNNFTDCGLYVLQYVEQFFLDPIRDYKLPIKQLSSWFDTLAVTRKREEIANLLQTLANENKKSQKLVFPDIPFPTQNGVLVEQPEEYNVEFEEDEIDDEPIDETDTSCGDFDTSVETEDGNIKESPSKMTSASEPQAKKFVFKRRLPILTPVETSSTTSTTGTPARLNSVKMRKLD